MRAGSSGTRALRLSIERLKKRAGMGQRNCPACRLYFRTSLFDPAAPAPSPEDFATSRCELCGCEVVIDLTDVPEEERELHRFYHSITLEDQHTDRRAFAFKVWWLRRLGINPVAAQNVKAGSDASGDATARALRKLREEKNELLERKKKRLAAKYGNDGFPDVVAQLKSAADEVLKRRREHLQIRGVSELVDREVNLSVQSELEKVIWGESRTQTVSLLGRVAGQIRRFVEEEQARLRTEDEEVVRRRSEEEEATRLRRAAREAAERSLKEVAEREMRVFDFEAYERQHAGGISL